MTERSMQMAAEQEAESDRLRAAIVDRLADGGFAAVVHGDRILVEDPSMVVRPPLIELPTDRLPTLEEIERWLVEGGDTP